MITSSEPQASRVLLVEDDPAHVRIIQRAFETDSGPRMTLVVAASLAEARVVIRQRPPAIIVADLILPDGKGTELIGAIDGRSFPVVIMTSHGDEGIAVESLKSGAIDYVEKTAASLAEVPRCVRRSLREWTLQTLRRAAEAALAASESRIRAILNAIPDLILIHDRTGRVLECEGGSSMGLGDNRARIVGMELFQLVLPACAARMTETIEAVCADGKTRSALYEIDLGGETRVFDSKLVRYEQQKVLAILRDITDRHLASAQLAKLSPREHDVLSLIVEGRTNKAIGVRLGIGIKTVETHRANIMKKLKARTVADLLRLAFAAEQQ